jgi:hypothetical protein
VFTSSYLPNSAHPDDGPRISPERVQPPFLTLPGLKLCYEGMALSNAGSMLPFYCYLAAIPAKPGDVEKLKATIQAELKQKIKEAPDAWEEIDATDPNGKPLRWARLRFASDQPFRVKESDKVNTIPLAAIFDLWVYDAPDWIVLVCWRAPTAAEQPANPPPGGIAAAIAAGQAAGPAGELRLNLSTMPALVAGTLTIGDAAPAPAADDGKG